ncbi:hypothetical protein [Nonomuraea ferruginea]|uniref:MarR family transcriptional regulator n=1 Tax=Nonomuraea ferruginea TaxID=46174 RepID=A0ABT4T272_9ACTN|nr:hypothetical protein [Nonomuraea ferruginea]MDA0643613.1 hypothetical protein [Nonomuraea ferruginea]
MSERKLSLPEFAALMALAEEAGEISNLDLKQRHGLTIDGQKRRKLNELKLVDSWKQGRSYVHVLTDSGWARLEENLRAGELPAMTGSPGVIARGLRSWLQKYMDRSRLRLADVSTPLETAPSIDVAPVDEPPGDLEARIRAAYARLAPRPGSWVGLARLRPLLGDAPRDEVDGALVRMERLPDVNLVPESNQKSFTPEEREAGVIIGGQEKHLLWIGEA